MYVQKEWDHKACNSTFRYVNDAFCDMFPEIKKSQGAVRLSTEPKSCAKFTMRYRKDHDEDVLEVVSENLGS